MRRSRKFSLILLCLVAAAGAVAAKEDPKAKEPSDTKQQSAKKAFLKNKTALQDEKKSPSKTPQAKTVQSNAPAPAPGQKPLPKLSLPLVQGQTSKGVTIPYNDGSGVKTMNFRIGAATPLDANHVEMKDLTIETLDELGEKEMTIELPGSMLDLTTRIITGNERVTIRRSDFEITGATMEFNTETKQGHIEGDVKMIIFDLSEKTAANSSTSEGRSK